MSEQNTGLEEYSYEGVMPQDAKNWGFKIERQEMQDKLPVREIFKDPQAGVSRAKADLKERIAKNDGVTVTNSIDQQNQPGTALHLKIGQIEAKTPNEAIAAAIDALPESVIGELYSSLAVDYAALEDRIQWGTMGQLNSNVLDKIKEAFPDFPSENIDMHTFLSQINDAYEFESWGNIVRLYNFSEIPISDEKLGEITNALRAVGEVTGGAIFDHLSNIVIPPEGHPALMDAVKLKSFASNSDEDIDREVLDQNTESSKELDISKLVVAGRTLSPHVFIHKKFLQQSSSVPSEPKLTELPVIEDQVTFSLPERTKRRVVKTLLGRYTQRQQQVESDRSEHVLENAEEKFFSMVGKLPLGVGSVSSLEEVAIHEFHHILALSNPEADKEFKDKIGKAYHRGELGFELPPTKIGEFVEERFPEVGRARIVGGNADKLVGPRHRKAYHSFVERIHSNREGPTHVTCRQLDLEALSNAPPKLKAPVNVITELS